MGQKACEEKMANPEKFYKTPESVLADPKLSTEEKDKILHNWEDDAVALLRADEENMTPQKAQAPQKDPAVVLEKIKEAETKLEEQEGPLQ